MTTPVHLRMTFIIKGLLLPLTYATDLDETAIINYFPNVKMNPLLLVSLISENVCMRNY
jgi:hypothetical protein